MKNKDILLQLGRRVRTLRKEAGYSQEGFALACELDRSYMGAIERGQQNVSVLNLHILATTLKISLAELMEGVGVEESPSNNGMPTVGLP